MNAARPSSFIRATWPMLGWLGVLWTSPNTVVGLFVGLVALPFGARLRWRRRDWMLVFNNIRWGHGALTLGNVVLHTGDTLDVWCRSYADIAGRGSEPPVSLAAHERAHVWQYMALGPFFLPLYLLCGGISARNRFERAADRYGQTGKGWWPY